MFQPFYGAGQVSHLRSASCGGLIILSKATTASPGPAGLTSSGVPFPLSKFIHNLSPELSPPFSHPQDHLQSQLPFLRLTLC